MKYRMDGRTGNALSALGFGCMRLPRGVGGVDMKKSEQLVMRAIGEGVNYFDTAYLYPGIDAALGKILQDNQARDRVHIATKLPIANCRRTEDLDRFFGEQLQNLRTDRVDYYLMHNINSFAQWEALCGLGIEDWIRRQKEGGSILSAGFSFHGPCGEFMKVLEAYAWDFCQIQYNYSNENYQAGVTGLKRAAEKGLPVIIMEPLLGGKLANGLPKEAEAVFNKAGPELTPAAWGLRWLLDQPEVTVILSGMNREEQVADNLKTAEAAWAGMLTEEERAAYRQVVQIFQKSDKVPCTGCGYCMPCPKGVNIPGCFAAYNASYSMGYATAMAQYVTGTGANRRDNHMAGRCVACGTCEAHCPQGIQIRKELERVKKRMEPFYVRMGLSVARRTARKRTDGGARKERNQ